MPLLDPGRDRAHWTTPLELDDAVDAWHDGEGEGMDLHEYLGLTWDQYVAWIERAEFPGIPVARGAGRQ